MGPTPAGRQQTSKRVNDMSADAVSKLELLQARQLLCAAVRGCLLAAVCCANATCCRLLLPRLTSWLL